MDSPEGRREITGVPAVLHLSLAAIALALVVGGATPRPLWVVLFLAFAVRGAVQLRRLRNSP